MNLILLFPDDFVDGTNCVRLHGRRHKHVCDIHRARIGDELRVGLAGGDIGRGRVMHLNKDALEMEVVLDKTPPPALPVTLILALPRPNILKRVLTTVSAMGVKRIFLLNSRRVEKSFWLSPVLRPPKIKEQLILGLEQACDTILPEVQLRQRFKPFSEDELPHLFKGTLPLVAHPEALEPCPSDVQSSVTLMIGPEGGFIPYEIKKLAACGFKAVQLGQRVLPVEAAVPALLSKLFD